LGTLLYLFKLPLSVLFNKLSNKLFKRVEKTYIQNLSKSQCPNYSGPPLTFQFIPKPIDSVQIPNLTELTQHRFDILGSQSIGKTDFNYTQYDCNNIEEFFTDVIPESWTATAREIWSYIKSTNPNYIPIDWHIDIKSGYRWNSKETYNKQVKRDPSADVKTPWELSRLQHLPQMAATLDGSASKTVASEVLFQLLDFVSQNPVGYGVNHSCAMDVGIRISNICVTIDWLLQYDAYILDKRIQEILSNYVYQSGLHVLNTLEYRVGLTSNHYLGNVAGVFFAATYLDHPSTDKWLKWSIQELENCMARQFFIDGSNFEGSTFYHRLSGEMMLWCAALSLKFTDERLSRIEQSSNANWPYLSPLQKKTTPLIQTNKTVFTNGFWQKLSRSISFADFIQKPNGTTPQIGDNDSGRFIKVSVHGSWLYTAEFEDKYSCKLSNSNDRIWDEDQLNQSAFIEGGYALFNKTSNTLQPEAKIMSDLASNFKIDLTKLNSSGPPHVIKEFDVSESINFKAYKYKQTKTFRIDTSVDLDSLHCKYFSDFQLAVIKNGEFYLALVGASKSKQHHSWGHTHNDKLSVELFANGTNLLVDPGSYCYTPNPETRNKYRSVASHSTISFDGQEQNRTLPGSFATFNLRRETKFRLIKLSATEIIAEVKYRDFIHVRHIEITKSGVTVSDYANKEFKQHWNTGAPYSVGYGKELSQ